jgi:hypothetical protein
MAPAKTGSRAERESLRAAMLAQGSGVDEIAAEMRVRWGFALRAAYRHANGLTLDQAAQRCNTVANDADARISGSRVCDWESWPQAGRRPSAFNLVVLAKSYNTKWQALDERERLVLTELAPPNRQQHSGGGGLAAPREGIGVAAAGERGTDQPTALALTAAVARDSLAFARWAETSNVSASTLDHVICELSRIAINYVHAPLLPLFRDLIGLRGVAFDLLRTGRQYPQQAVPPAGTRAVLPRGHELFTDGPCHPEPGRLGLGDGPGSCRTHLR